MLRIEQTYLRLVRNILKTKDHILLNQVKQTSNNRRTISAIKRELETIVEDLDVDISGYLYKEDNMYKLDLYSNEYFEGQIIDKNLKQILNKIKGIYIKLLSINQNKN